MKKLLLILALACVSLSCEMLDEQLGNLINKKGEVVFVDGTELVANVPSKQTVLNYKFESTLNWETKTDVEWIEVDRANGKAGKDIHIQIKVHKNKGTKRTGHVDITLTNGKIYRITINQDGADDQENGNDETISDIPNNEIWYTSHGNNTIYPYDSEAFNAEIVSNIYYGDYGVITFDGELTEIGDYAFAHCNDLKSLSLPESVTSVGECLIKDCGCVESFGGKFASEDGTALIAGDTFVACAQSTSSEYYIIPDGIKRIGTCAFRECENITSLYIPDSVESIGEGAFSSSLGFQYFSGKHVTDDGLAVICNNTFIGYAHGNENTSYTIPYGVTRIGWYAFDNSIYLEEITIPESVVEIGDVALAFCYNLSDIYCRPTTPPMVLLDYNGGWEAFDCNMYNMKIYVPEEAYYDYINTEHWQNYTWYIVGYDFENSEYPETPNEIPNNEIWYTTYDEQIIWPYSGEENNFADTWATFGANIVSNSYENDKGIIEFDCDIAEIGIAAFYGCSNLESITLPDSVTHIRKRAFYGCTSLKSANIPNGVLEIGYDAFCSCISIRTITIPYSVEFIDDGAFVACSSLEQFCGKYASEDGRCLIIDGELNAFAPYGVTEYTIPNEVTKIGHAVFLTCTELQSITIPESVTEIDNWAFQACINLSEITIPDSVTSIGIYSFNDCISLTSVVIGDGLTRLGTCMFINCTNLTKVALGNSVNTIADASFSHCTSLTDINIPNSVTTIETNAFYNCTSLPKITIPESVTTIGPYAFCGCTSLVSVEIGDGVNTILEGVFCYCANLSNITIPESVTTIEPYAFYGCTSLANAEIGDGVSSIDECAFYGCSSLSNITIPDSVTMIGYAAFALCDSLKTVYCESTIPPTAIVNDYDYWHSFSTTNDYEIYDIGCTIYVPESSVNEYKSAQGWSQYAQYIVGYDFES